MSIATIPASAVDFILTVASFLGTGNPPERRLIEAAWRRAAGENAANLTATARRHQCPRARPGGWDAAAPAFADVSNGLERRS
jgi:hypothetical protein